MVDPLLTEIEAFCEAHGLSEAKFGVLALKDWKFVRELRGENRAKPRRIWPTTADEVRKFMVTYRPEPKKAAEPERARAA